MSIREDIIDEVMDDDENSNLKAVRLSRGGDGQSVRPYKDYFLYGLHLTMGHLVSATALSYILAGGPAQIPELYLAQSLNFLILPVVFFTGIFTFPLWVWYVIILSWIGSIGAVQYLKEGY